MRRWIVVLAVTALNVAPPAALATAWEVAQADREEVVVPRR